MPKPRTSIRPASAAAGRTSSRPDGLEVDAVVAHQAGETQQAGVGRLRAARAQVAICRRRPARGSARRAPDQHRRGVDGRSVAPPSHRRQAHDEARAEHRGRRRPRLARASAVLHPDAAAMRLDDLLGDREARARNSGRTPDAAGRCRSARRFSRSASGRTPGPSSSTTISISFRNRRQVTRTVPPGGENERALSIRLSITWPSRESWPGTTKLGGPPPSKVERHARPRRPCGTSLATVDQVLSSLVRSTGAASCRCISASRRLASEMSEISRSSRFTSCWMTREQPAAAFVGLGERQRLDRRAQRGERVLQLVRDVGGEALDRLDAAVERVGHVAQRARQVADLVAPAGEVGNLDARADAPAHPLGALSASRRTGPAMVPASRIDSTTITAAATRNTLKIGEPLGARPCRRCRRPASTA